MGEEQTPRTPSVHPVRDEYVTMPVEIRTATASTAQFLSPVRPARKLLSATGLEPVQPVPGRALTTLGFVHYIDGDLGPYHEFLVAILARRPGMRGTTGAYIHWLPVDQPFTCEAGQSIWGFPKEMAEIDVFRDGKSTRCAVRLDGTPVLVLRLGSGLPAPPGMGAVSIDAYTRRDGSVRRVPWSLKTSGVRVRPGGARVEWGQHPISDELRELELPRTAVLTSHIGQLRMWFHDAERIEG